VAPYQNFAYETTSNKQGFADSDVYGALCTAMGSTAVSNPKSGFNTTLTIKIPRASDHEYWLQSLSDVSWESEDGDDVMTFVVKRWGPTKEHSKYYATLRGKDIIRRVRSALTQAQPISSPSASLTSISRRTLDHCPIFAVGKRVQSMWKENKTEISEDSKTFWNHALAEIDREMTLHPDTSLLLNYYKALYYFRRILTAEFRFDEVGTLCNGGACAHQCSLRVRQGRSAHQRRLRRSGL
jgi:hypothetical protein